MRPTLEKQLLIFGGNYLLDLFPNAAAAYSVSRRLRLGYTGPLIRIRESSGNTEKDFGTDNDGNLSTGAITAFLAGANGFVVTLYDQGGNGRDITNATAAQQPQYIANALNGRPVARFSSASDQRLSSVAFSAALIQPNTIYFVANVTKAVGADSYLYDGLSAGNRNSLRRQSAENLVAFSGTDLALKYAITSPLAYTIWCTIFNGASSALYANEVLKSSANPGTNPMNGLRVGINSAQTAGVGLTGDVAEIIIYSGSHNVGQRGVVERSLASAYAIALG